MKKGDKVRCVKFNDYDSYSSDDVKVGNIYIVEQVFPNISDYGWFMLSEGNFTFIDDEDDLRLTSTESCWDAWEVVND